MKFQEVLSSLDVGNPNNSPDSIELFQVLLEKFDTYNSNNRLVSVTPDKIKEIIASEDLSIYLNNLGVDREIVTMLANSMAANHKIPIAFFEIFKSEDVIKSIASETLNKHIIGDGIITGDEAGKIIELFENGGLFSDIAFTLIQALKLASSPWSLRDRPINVLDVLIDLPVAIISDISPYALAEFFVDQLVLIANGKAPEQPIILNNTLKNIYELPILLDVIEVLHNLLGPENESLRLALIIYARIHSIKLKDEDIDEIRSTVLDVKNPQLGKFLYYAVMNSPELLGI